MTVNISVIRPEDRDREFLADIAPFFMRQDVRKALPYLKDTPEKIWLLAREGEKVVGIAGIIPHKNGVAELCSLYVELEYRGRNISENLVATRLKLVEGARVIRVVCAPPSLKFYAVRGFKAVAKRGSYTVVELKAEGRLTWSAPTSPPTPLPGAGPSKDSSRPAAPARWPTYVWRRTPTAPLGSEVAPSSSRSSVSKIGTHC